MPLKTCWLCDNELTTTKEHIIPESMGGKKTVQGFICRDCNSMTGHNWDVAVTNFHSWQFHINANLCINPQQEKPIRGKLDDSNLNVFIGPGVQMRMGFNPPIKTQEEAGKEVYHFISDPSRVDDLFDSINTLYQRKGKNPLTRDEFNARIRHSVTPQPVVTFPLKLDIPKYYRSLVKTAMAMAFFVGVDPLYCENAVGYLRDETIDEQGVVTMPDTSLEGNIGDWTDYHAVTVFGFPDARMLIGEVLYFGSVAGLVILSNSYEGPSIIAGHVINLRTGEYVDTDLNLPPLLLPTKFITERVEQFRSPMVLDMLSRQNQIIAQTQ